MSVSRTKAITLRVSSRMVLLVRLRRFRVSKQTRSSKTRQLVIRTNMRGVRQVAIQLIPKSQAGKYQRPGKSRNLHLGPSMLMAAGLLGIIFFMYQVLVTPQLTIAEPSPGHAQKSVQVQAPATSAAAKPYSLSRSEPVRVQVTRVGIDTGIKSVGRNADGTIETPSMSDTVAGWYKFGPTPGETGPAVIVGHVDTYAGPSVFWKLRELQPGDEISITRADGSVATFTVESLAQFDQDNFPTQTIYGNIDYAGLRLVTCGGTFNRNTGHYSANTVVFAKLNKT